MRMNLPLFPQYDTCRQCDLHQYATSVGIATRGWDGGNTGKKRAVLLLGKAPAVREDKENKNLIGENGQYVNGWYIEGMGLQEVADIYLQNAVRCRLPNSKMAVPLGAKRACRGHIESDLILLDEVYEDVAILCLGSEAISSVYGENVAMTALRQGTRVSLGGKPRAVFGTYLPTYVVEDPAKMTAVEDHLRLLKEYLVNGFLVAQFDIQPQDVNRDKRIPTDVSLVSIDTETYGFFTGYPDQRFFHPAKCIRLDNVQPGELVQSAAAAWRDSDGTLHHRFYDLTNPQAKADFLDDVVRHPGRTILGQNIPFDVMMLRAWDPEIAKLWVPFGPMKLEELMVLNFWDSDQRPERGLKPVSTLLGTTDYEEEELALKDGRKFLTANDDANACYNTRDAVATLLNAEKFKGRYVEKFGPHTSKGTKESLDWYSDLCWLGISMSEEGIGYDVEKLTRLSSFNEKKLDTLEDWTLTRFGFVMRREGAKGRAAAWLKVLDKVKTKIPKTPKGRIKRAQAIRDLLAECGDWKKFWRCGPSDVGTRLVVGAIQECGIQKDKRIKKTDIGGQISSGLENVNLCLGYAKGETRLALRTMKRFDEIGKLTSVLRPMVGLKLETKKDWNNFLIDGRTYPTWRLVPSVDESGETGGTQQGRITARNRAVQVDPPPIENSERSRHPDGALIRIDLSQAELRVPLLWSREDHIRDLFLRGESLHSWTAEMIFGHPVTKKDHYLKYQLGKTSGLAIQFRAMARKLRETALRDNGYDRPLSFWEDVIEKLWAARKGLIQVQDEWIASAGRDGFLALPVLGLSRTFLGNVEETYVPTIVNVLVQSVAALLCLDAQITAEKWLRQNGWRTRLIKNTYDEGSYDVPAEEIPLMVVELPKFYKNPPLLGVLVREHGLYEIPLDASVTVSYNTPPPRKDSYAA